MTALFLTKRNGILDRIIVTRDQWIRIVDELPGEFVVFGFAQDPRHPPIYCGFVPIDWRSPAIALGRGFSVDEAIDNAIAKIDENRRVRRLTKSPVEWCV